MSSNNYYVSGDWWVTCDVCSTKTKASKSKQRWDGFQVCPTCFEHRQPQDFVKAKTDKISVPFVRPIQTPDYYVCTLQQCVAITGIGVAGCSVAAKSNAYER